MAACEKHTKNPAWGYSQCPGCEVERQREQISKLKAEVERLTAEMTKAGHIIVNCAKSHEIQRTTGENLMLDNLKLIVERDQYKAVYLAAKGLTTGYDWNNGTHAKIYRSQLIDAVDAVDSAEAHP